jgi:hypothetical protein
MARWAGVLALGAIGLWLGAARGQGRRLVAYALWITVGLGVILVQRWSWWSYHYMLLAVPTGVLAARGLDLLAQGLARLEPARAGRLRTGALVTCVLLLTATSLGSLGFKTALLARSRFAISSADRSHFQQRAESDVREISDEVRFLRAPGTRQGALFTLGDALYNWLSGRDFPGERLGGLLTPNATRADWDRWGDMLDRQAPAWIFVQDDFRNLLLREPAFGSRFTAAFANGYVFSHHSRRGSWYERTGPATKPLPAAGR